MCNRTFKPPNQGYSNFKNHDAAKENLGPTRVARLIKDKHSQGIGVVMFMYLVAELPNLAKSKEKLQRIGHDSIRPNNSAQFSSFIFLMHGPHNPHLGNFLGHSNGDHSVHHCCLQWKLEGKNKECLRCQEEELCPFQG